jgi:hypothetical protein
MRVTARGSTPVAPLAVVMLVLAACPGAKPPQPPVLTEPVQIGRADRRSDLLAELIDEMLKAYDRDEPPEPENRMLLPEIGPARIGVGPGDVLITSELARAPSRWPLDLQPSTRQQARSKRLEIHLAKDETAAWATDEISWRLELCGLTTVIPLRLTALFARDGDRWVSVFEHLSFGRTPMPTRAGQLPPKQITTAVASRDLADELSRVLSPVLRRALDKSPQVISTGPEAALLGADITAEWHDEDVLEAKLVPGSQPMRLEDRRVGIVGRSVDEATIAYWIGNVTAMLPARPGVAGGLGYFRATFVFERREGAWVIVQGHVSHAIEDAELATAVFGTALISSKPLAIACDAGRGP